MLQIIRDEGCPDRVQVALQELLLVPAEGLPQIFILLFESDVGDCASICADADGQTCPVKLVESMLGHFGVDVRLQIARRADFEVDVLRAKLIEERWVLGAPYTVSYASGFQKAQRLPDAFGAACLTRVRSALEAVLTRELVGWSVGGGREASFVTRKIQCYDVGPAKTLHQFYGLEALLRREMSEGAEDQPGFDPGIADLGSNLATYDIDYIVGGQTAGDMKERCEANLAVDDVVGSKLLEEVGGYQS